MYLSLFLKKINGLFWPSNIMASLFKALCASQYDLEVCQTFRYLFLSVVIMFVVQCTCIARSTKFHKSHAFTLYAGFKPASRSSLPARRFAVTPRDHRLLLQSYSSQHPHRFGFISERHRFRSELNRIQLSVVSRCGQSGGEVIDLLAKRCLPLGFPSAASVACAVVQKISIEAAMRRAASGKLVWKQHYSAPLMSMREGGRGRYQGNEGLSHFFFFTPGLQYHMPKLQSMNYTLFCFEGAVFLRS